MGHPQAHHLPFFHLFTQMLFLRQNGETALVWAANNGHAACVEALVGAGALVDHQNKVRNCVSLLAASCSVICGRVNFVLQEGWTALMVAAREGHVTCLEALVHSGAHINHAAEVVNNYYYN